MNDTAPFPTGGCFPGAEGEGQLKRPLRKIAGFQLSPAWIFERIDHAAHASCFVRYLKSQYLA